MEFVFISLKKFCGCKVERPRKLKRFRCLL